MTVAELIEALRLMPQDATVWHVWDGGPRTEIQFVWTARVGNRVITADVSENCYDDDDRPANAPTERQSPYWSTPADPRGIV